MQKKVNKSARFAGLKVTEEFLNKTIELKDRHKFTTDTELIETSISFLNLASDARFSNMKVSEFLSLFFDIKKGQ
jgi:hypothetical protein